MYGKNVIPMVSQEIALITLRNVGALLFAKVTGSKLRARRNSRQK
jgi:hypothetical protein